VITRRPGAGEGRTVRLDLGGAAADEGSDWRGAQEQQLTVGRSEQQEQRREEKPI